jgi:hypothetical protein
VKSDDGGDGAGAPKAAEDADRILGEVTITAVYLQNRLPVKSLADHTPYEAWHGRKPTVNHLRVFGCREFVKHLDHVDKLTDRSRAGVFIGYVKGAKVYRILDPTTRPASPRAPSSPTPSVRAPAAPPSTPVATPSPQSGAASVAGPAAPPPEFVTPLENDDERLNAAHGESPMRYHTYDNIIGVEEHMPGLAARNLIEELNLMSTGESCTFAEAEQDTAWQAVMQEEIDSVKRNQT